MPTKLCMMVEAGDDHPGVPWCACFIIISIFSNGTWLTREPPCRFFFQTVLSQTQTFNFYSMSLQYLYGFRNLFGENHFEFSRRWSSTNSCQVYLECFLARKMHSTSEFAMIVLSTCVYLCVYLCKHVSLRASMFESLSTYLCVCIFIIFLHLL